MKAPPTGLFYVLKGKTIYRVQRMVLKEGPNKLRDKKIRDDALKILEEHGSVMLITEGKKKIIKVNPKLFED